MLSIITVPELMYQVQTMAAETFTAFDAIFAMAIFYWLLVEAVSRLGARVEARVTAFLAHEARRMSAPMIELAKVSKSFGAHQVLRERRPLGRRSEVVCLIGPERVGQEHAAPMREFSRALRFRRSAHRRAADRLRGRERNSPADGAARLARDAARDRHGVPALQSLAAYDGAQQCRRTACGACASCKRAKRPIAPWRC